MNSTCIGSSSGRGKAREGKGRQTKAGFRLVLIRRVTGVWMAAAEALTAWVSKHLRRRRPLPLPASGVLACF